MGYNGTIELIAGVKPANNGNFPMVNAKDVYVDDDTRLDAKLNGLDDSIDDLNAAVVTDATLSQTGKPADAKAVGDAINNITIEVDATLSQSGKAADAKATGDAVGDLKTQFDAEFIPDTSPNLLNPAAFNTAYRINGNGILVTSIAGSSNPINVENASYIAIYAPSNESMPKTHNYSFATDDLFTSESLVDHDTFTVAKGSSEPADSIVILPVPTGAKWFAFGFNTSTEREYVAGLGVSPSTHPYAQVQIVESATDTITDWRSYGDTTYTFKDIVQTAGANTDKVISQKGVTDLFVQKSDVVGATGSNTDKILSQKASTELYDNAIKNGDIVLTADAQVDDSSSDYYAYRDFDNFPINTTIRISDSARVRPRLTVGGTHVYQDAYFTGNSAARAAYVGQTVTVTSGGESVTGTVDAQSTWLKVALDHSPISFSTLGHSGEPIERGINAVVTTFYSNTKTGSSTRYKVQFCVIYTGTNGQTPYLCWRIQNGSTWSAWSSLTECGVLHASNRVVDVYTYNQMTFGDFNDAPANTIYQVDLNCGSTVKHNPCPGQSGVLFTYAFSVSTRHALVQNYYALINDKIFMFFRYGYQYTSSVYKWTPWEKPATTSVYTAAANVPLVSGNVPGTALASPSAGETGTEITLTATAAEGYTFDHWEVTMGEATIENNKFTLANKNVEVDAVFVVNS